MASRYWVGGNANWDATAGSKWALTSGGAGGQSVPTNADDVFLDNGTGTGNVTISSVAVCKSFTCTGYVGTLTMNATLTVSGSVTLVSAMTIAGTSDLICNATGTLTSNGKTLTGGLQLAGTSQTYTLADSWTITGSLTLSGVTAITVNGSFNLNVGTSLIVSTNTGGSATIVLTGTGTWSASSYLTNNLKINTSGTITFGSAVYYYSGGGAGSTFSYVAGQVITNGNTFNLYTGSAVTLDLNGMELNNIQLNAGALTVTLLSNLTIKGNMVFSSAIILNGFSLFAKGGMDSSFSVSGTTKMFFIGTGSLTNNSTWSVTIDITINTGGIITIPSYWQYGGGTLTYLKGRVVTKGSTFSLSANSTLINMHLVSFNQIIVTAGVALTMNEFFCGNPNQKTKVVSSTNSNYTIAFQNGTRQKKAFFVNVKNATFNNTNLLSINGGNANSGSNIGVLFGDVGVGGTPLNMFPTEMSYSTNGFLPSMNN